LADNLALAGIARRLAHGEPHLYQAEQFQAATAPVPESSNALFPDAQEAPETLQPLIDLPSVSEARLHRLRRAETRYEPPPHHNPNQLHQRSALPRPSRQTAHEALMPAESQRRQDQAGTVHHAWVMSFKKHAQGKGAWPVKTSPAFALYSYISSQCHPAAAAMTV
jgi:hypothetical protein